MGNCRCCIDKLCYKIVNMKMKYTIWIVTLLLFACNNPKSNNNKSDETTPSNDTVQISEHVEPEKEIAKEFANERFRKVTIEKKEGNKYQVKGQAQIFEATFNWVVEDGHNELKNGFTTTDAGAPEWGKFDFTIEVKKTNEYSTLHIILFEVSAKDGSRQYELPIPLK